jgi:hypothetical protein
MKYILNLFILIIFFFFNRYLISSESDFYTVSPLNLPVKVYSEHISRYCITSRDSEFTLPETSKQKILGSCNENSIYKIILECGNIQNNLKEINYDFSSYISDSRLLNLYDPEIQTIKSKFIYSKDKISDVEKFVYNYISDKTIGIPIISASEIIKNKSGDCTEHTVLAVSILRSLGIPARALIGMVLSEEFEGSRNVFVYHMWAEAFINGKWVPVDATRPGQKHHNLYIAFAYHHLQTEMPLSYLKAVSAMKTFSVEYIDK